MNHHRLIRSLIANVRKARQDIAELEDSVFYGRDAVYRAERRASDAQEEAYRSAEEERRRRYDQQDAIHALNKALDLGDQWHIDRVRRRLRTL